MKEETRKILEEMGVGILPPDDPIYTGVKLPTLKKEEKIAEETAEETDGEKFLRYFLLGRGDGS